MLYITEIAIAGLCYVMLCICTNIAITGVCYVSVAIAGLCYVMYLY